MIKNNDINGKQWKMGFFLGVSSCKRIVHLGLVVVLNENKENYVRIFKTFFEAMKGQPKVIVTDEEKTLLAAIE
jgi:hypothetical protein